MDNRRVSIGNETFKEWLKNQDTQARSQRIIDIGQTLHKMGIRGTDILSMYTQLSQSCKVMIVRLTEKEIYHHTRRIPYQEHKNPDRVFHHQDRNHKTRVYISKDEVKITTSKKGKKLELMKELFGEEDTGDVTSKVRKIQEDNCIRSEKEVNPRLATVNVNYYNYNIINPSPTNETSSNDYSRKKKYTDNTLLSTCSVPSKKIRIDLSLPNDSVSDIHKDTLVNVRKSNEELCSNNNQISPKKMSSKKSSKRRSSGKNKTRMDSSQKGAKMSLQTKDTEEDPSIKELWSILGMESPTDRKAKFLSDQSNFNFSNNLEQSSCNTNPSVSSLNKADQDPSILVIEKSNETCNKSIPTGISVDNIQHNNTTDTFDTFLRISEPFSLANIDSNSAISDDAINFSNTNEENIILIPNVERGEDTNSVETGGKTSSFTDPDDFTGSTSLEKGEEVKSDKMVDPRAICEMPTQGTSSKKNPQEDNSKVGTIRVKSLGSLMNTQHQPSSNETSVTSTDVVQGVSSEKPPDDIFFETYTYYFDDLVEAKIPKLGELLHLAIADHTRLTERAKRADQLSSEDLIREEKQRALKDFFEMMKLRGEEFSALCDTIIKKFETLSKVTLFYALFYRVLKHAGSIDPVNEIQILSAKKVFRLMLEKHQYKDKQILEPLQNDVVDFLHNYKIVKDRVVDCMLKINSLTARMKSNNSSNDSRSSVICKPAPKTQVTKAPQNITPKTTVVMSEEDLKRHQFVLIDPSRANGTVNQRIGSKHSTTKILNRKIKETTNQQTIPPQKTSTSNTFSTMQVKNAQTDVNIQSHLLQAAIEKNPNFSDKVSIPSLIARTNIQPKSRPNVPQNITIPPNRPMHGPNNQLGPGKEKEQQSGSQYHQQSSKNIHIPSQTIKSCNNAGTSSKTVTTPIVHKPSQHLATSGQSYQTILPGINDIKNSLPGVSITPILNPSAPKQLVGTSAQRSSTVRPNDVLHRNGCSVLPGRRNILINQQQSPNMSAKNERVPNYLNPFGCPSLTRQDIVNNSVTAFMRAESNNNQRSGPHKGNTTNIGSKVSVEDGKILPTLLSGSSSHQTTSEMSSSNTEMNLPSSSHCHPFIVRRPINGNENVFWK